MHVNNCINESVQNLPLSDCALGCRPVAAISCLYLHAHFANDSGHLMHDERIKQNLNEHHHFRYSHVIVINRDSCTCRKT